MRRKRRGHGGPPSVCVCPNCGTEVEHQRGYPAPVKSVPSVVQG
ncbi:MAG: hypothetical protein ACOC7O_02545 [Thermoplasmatota archaeon]